MVAILYFPIIRKEKAILTPFLVLLELKTAFSTIQNQNVKYSRKYFILKHAFVY
jgi:hypothetical protein